MNAYEVFIGTQIEENPFWMKDITLRKVAMKEYVDNIIYEASKEIGKMTDMVIDHALKNFSHSAELLHATAEVWQELIRDIFLVLNHNIEKFKHKVTEEEILILGFQLDTIVENVYKDAVAIGVSCFTEYPKVDYEKCARNAIVDTIDDLYEVVENQE